MKNFCTDYLQSNTQDLNSKIAEQMLTLFEVNFFFKKVFHNRYQIEINENWKAESTANQNETEISDKLIVFFLVFFLHRIKS
jgi:hypothetical protein